MIASVQQMAALYDTAPSNQQAAKPAPKAETPQDSVQLSHAAQKAAQDKDSDGDSH